ncbi:MAG: hypothetical protein ABII25_07870 [bacterium]
MWSPYGRKISPFGRNDKWYGRNDKTGRSGCHSEQSEESCIDKIMRSGITSDELGE